MLPSTYIRQVEGMPTKGLAEDIPTINESDGSGVKQIGRLTSDVQTWIQRYQWCTILLSTEDVYFVD